MEGRTRREKLSWGPLGLAREQSGLARRASEGRGRQGVGVRSYEGSGLGAQRNTEGGKEGDRRCLRLPECVTAAASRSGAGGDAACKAPGENVAGARQDGVTLKSQQIIPARAARMAGARDAGLRPSVSRASGSRAGWGWTCPARPQ